MGLDTVELILAVEDEFHISIPDGAAAKMIKVKHMVDFVYASIHGTYDVEGLWQELDEMFESVTGYTISKRPLDTDLRGLLTSGKEVAQLEQLGLHEFIAMPRLVRFVFYPVCITAAVLAAGCFIWQGLWQDAVFAFFAVLIVTWMVLMAIATRFRRVVETEIPVSKLVWWTDLNVPQSDSVSISRSEVFETVAELIVHQLGVQRQQVVEEARFVQDLGAD